MLYRYVTIKPRAVAETEHDALQVELAEEGSEDAHLKIISPYKHVSHGNEVLLDDDVGFVSGNENDMKNDDLVYLYRRMGSSLTYGAKSLSAMSYL